MAGDLWLADTNVLIRWVQPQDSSHQLARSAIQRLEELAAVPCYMLQNIAEFWNTLTRPIRANGYGFSLSEADRHARVIESRFRLLGDSFETYNEWRRLLVAYGISGVQVHDARLVAVMLSHGVNRILTFNTRDFARYSQIEAIHPSQV